MALATKSECRKMRKHKHSEACTQEKKKIAVSCAIQKHKDEEKADYEKARIRAGVPNKSDLNMRKEITALC